MRAARRRGRPGRRRVRGVPAGGARRLRDHHPGARPDRRRDAAARSCSPATAPARCTTRSSAAASTTGWSTRTSTARWRSCAAGCRRSTERLAAQVAAAAQRMRELDLIKPPGVAESMDWAGALGALGAARPRPRGRRRPRSAPCSSTARTPTGCGRPAWRRCWRRDDRRQPARRRRAGRLRPHAAARRRRRRRRDRVQAMLGAVDALGVRPSVYWAGRLTLCAEPDDLPSTTRRSPRTSAVAGRRAAAAAAGAARAAEHRRAVRAGPPPDRRTATDEEPAVLGVPASPDEVLRHRDVAGADRRRARRGAPAARAARAGAPRCAARAGAGRPGAARSTRARTVRRDAAARRRADRGCGAAGRRHRPRRLVAAARRVRLDDAVRRRAAAVRARRGAPAADADRGVHDRHPADPGHPGAAPPRPGRGAGAPPATRSRTGPAAPGWPTRCGPSCDRWGQRGTARGAVVVVCSDGWERGDPALLAEQLARLARLAHRWSGSTRTGARPATRRWPAGWRRRCRTCDDFVAGHSMAALEELVEVIARA